MRAIYVLGLGLIIFFLKIFFQIVILKTCCSFDSDKSNIVELKQNYMTFLK
jgi:hypothetical protein